MCARTILLCRSLMGPSTWWSMTLRTCLIRAATDQRILARVSALGGRSAKENGYRFAHTYPAFVREAWRVLEREGILLCKIADYVHNHRYQWAHVELIVAAQSVGFTACDCIIKVRKGPIVDLRWKVAHHSRRRGRLFSRCHRAGSRHGGAHVGANPYPLPHRARRLTSALWSRRRLAARASGR